MRLSAKCQISHESCIRIRNFGDFFSSYGQLKLLLFIFAGCSFYEIRNLPMRLYGMCVCDRARMREREWVNCTLRMQKDQYIVPTQSAVNHNLYTRRSSYVISINVLRAKKYSKFSSSLNCVAVDGCERKFFVSIGPFVCLKFQTIHWKIGWNGEFICVEVSFNITSINSPILNGFINCLASLEWPKSSNSLVQSLPATSPIKSPPPGC